MKKYLLILLFIIFLFSSAFLLKTTIFAQPSFELYSLNCTPGVNCTSWPTVTASNATKSGDYVTVTATVIDVSGVYAVTAVVENPYSGTGIESMTTSGCGGLNTLCEYSNAINRIDTTDWPEGTYYVDIHTTDYLLQNSWGDGPPAWNTYKTSFCIGSCSGLSSNATLSNLTISSGTLSPAFASGTTSYTDNVANSVASVTVTPTRNESHATITVNGTAVASGSASGPIVLTNIAPNTNTVTIAVTAEDGTIKNYTIAVTRAAANSSDATVTSTAYTVGALTGGAGIITNVPSGTSKTTFLAALAKHELNQTWNDTGIHSTVATGDTLVVTAQNGTTATYTVTVNTVLSSNATISAGTLASQALSGTFTGGASIVASSALAVTVPDANKTNAALALTKGNANSVVKYVKGSQPSGDGNYTGTYSAGSTTFTVVNNDIIWLLVTAENTTTKLYYKITVTVPAANSSDAAVTSTAYTVGALTGGAGIITNVPSGTSKTTFLAALAKNEAHQTWNDTGIHSTVATGDTLVVTAQNGATATYTVTVFAGNCVKVSGATLCVATPPADLGQMSSFDVFPEETINEMSNVALMVALSGAAGELVYFRDDASPYILGSAITNSSGIAIYNYKFPLTTTQGTHNLKAIYNGNMSQGFTASSRSASVEVDFVGGCATTSGATICIMAPPPPHIPGGQLQEFSVNQTPAHAGTTVILTARLSGPEGEPIYFRDSALPYILGPAITNSSGIATFNYTISPATAIGSHTLKAIYDGNASWGLMADSMTASLAVEQSPCGTGSSITDSRNSKNYPIVPIGEQCWMAKNLDYDNGCSYKTWQNNTDVGWCGYYTGVTTEGKLYQWSAATATTSGLTTLCPTGWHLPSDAEITIMETALGTDVGTKLKAGGISGFNILMSGYRNNTYGDYVDRWASGYFWSSTSGGAQAYRRAVASDNNLVNRSYASKALAFPVRCVKGL